MITFLLSTLLKSDLKWLEYDQKKYIVSQNRYWRVTGGQLYTGLEKIKIVQYPRDFPDELSKFTKLFITLSPPCPAHAHVPSLYTQTFNFLQTAFVSWIDIIQTVQTHLSNIFLLFRQLIHLCLIDYYCLDSKTSLSNRILSYTQFRCLCLIYDHC